MANILGISPGTRSIGIAYFIDEKLIDWDIRSFPEKWSEVKFATILSWVKEYIDANEVESIAIKIPDELPTSYSYIKLIATMNVLFEQKSMYANYYTLSDIKRHWCSDVIASKFTLLNCIADKYPQLAPVLQKERSNYNSYYNKIFEAVAAGRLLYEQLDK